MTLRELFSDSIIYFAKSLNVALWQENWLDAEIRYVFGAICLYILGLWLALTVLEKLQNMIKKELALYDKAFAKKALKVVVVCVLAFAAMIGFMVLLIQLGLWR